MASNRHKVAKRQWAKWNKTEQAMYNRAWRRFDEHELLILGIPLTTKNDRLRIIRHNLAFEMADLMKEWRGFWSEPFNGHGVV